MAYVSIPQASIEVGQPTKQELFQTIKDDLDDHESRLTTNEAAVNNFEPITFSIVGQGAVADDLFGHAYRFTRGLTLLGFRVVTGKDAGSSGTATFDVELSTDNGSSFSSILSSTVDASTTAYATVSGTLATTSVSAGDLLIINMDAIRTGASGFFLALEYEVA